MNKIIYTIVLAALIFCHKKVRSQVDSVISIEAFAYDSYGRVLGKQLNSYIWSWGKDFRNAKEIYYEYPSDGSSVDFVQSMYASHILNKPLCVTNVVGEGNVWGTASSEVFIYDIDKPYSLKKTYALPASFNTPVRDFHTGSTYSIDSAYQLVATVDSSDQKGRPLQITDRSGISSCFFYNRYGHTLGSVQNATWDEVAYTSFETSDVNGFNTGWDIAGLAVSAVNPYQVGGEVLGAFTSCEKNGLDTDKEYFLSFWARSADGTIDYDIDVSGGSIELVDIAEFFHGYAGVICKYRISGASAVSVVRNGGTGSGNIYLDELRLYPTDAFMDTKTYALRSGKYLPHHSVNALEKWQTVEYDYLGRLTSVRDHNGNMVVQKNYYPWNY